MILIRIENRREGIKKKKRDRRRFEQFRLCVGDFKLSVVPSVSKDIFFHGGNICEGSRAWNFNTPPPDVWNFNISSGRKSWAFRGLIIALISHSWFCCYKYSNRFTPRKRFQRITGGGELVRFSITRIFISRKLREITNRKSGISDFFTSSCKILDVSWRDRPRGGGVSNPSAVIDDVSREGKISPFRKV